MNKITNICLSICIVLIMKSNFAFGMMEDDRRPDEHPCSITMTNPVVADGHSYESAASIAIVPRPVMSDIVMPEIARGNEEVYKRFIMGKLIYKPDPTSDAGKIELLIRALANPLEGTFDLSQCGDSGRYLSIATGYRKGKKPENANKLEIWLAPRFLVEKDLSNLSANHHLRVIISGGNWDAARVPVGIFWTWGDWDAADHMAYCDYLTRESMEELGSENLYEKSVSAVEGSNYCWSTQSACECASYHIGEQYLYIFKHLTFCL